MYELDFVLGKFNPKNHNKKEKPLLRIAVKN